MSRKGPKKIAKLARNRIGSCTAIWMKTAAGFGPNAFESHESPKARSDSRYRP
jgi:hypothetical protein